MELVLKSFISSSSPINWLNCGGSTSGKLINGLLTSTILTPNDHTARSCNP